MSALFLQNSFYKPSLRQLADYPLSTVELSQVPRDEVRRLIFGVGDAPLLSACPFSDFSFAYLSPIWVGKEIVKTVPEELDSMSSIFDRFSFR